MNNSASGASVRTVSGVDEVLPRRHRIVPLSRRRLTNLSIQVILLASFLLLWQYLPDVHWARQRAPFLDPFFISSPSGTARELADLVTGSNGAPSVWPYARSTIEASVFGTILGTIIGGGLGLLLSNSRRLSEVLKPFIVAMNAVPRIAIIPIIVIICGPTLESSIVVSVTVVVFVVFFNAYAGGLSVSPHVLQNARLLGASPIQVMLNVRLPYVLAWTVAALPNAISFSLVSVVTAEILTGTIGMGRLLLSSVTTIQASLTVASAVILSVVGVILVGLSEVLQRRQLHWWARD